MGVLCHRDGPPLVPLVRDLLEPLVESWLTRAVPIRFKSRGRVETPALCRIERYRHREWSDDHEQEPAHASRRLYNMAVQACGMVSANSQSRELAFMANLALMLLSVYQASDSSRYFKANKGLLVICIWMCVSIASSCRLARPMYCRAPVSHSLLTRLVRSVPRHVLLLPMAKQAKGAQVGRYDARRAGSLPPEHDG